MDDYTDIYDGVQVREVCGGRLGTSVYGGTGAEDPADGLTNLEQRMRWVDESWSQLGARTAALERHQQVLQWQQENAHASQRPTGQGGKQLAAGFERAVFGR